MYYNHSTVKSEARIPITLEIRITLWMDYSLKVIAQNIMQENFSSCKRTVFIFPLVLAVLAPNLFWKALQSIETEQWRSRKIYFSPVDVICQQNELLQYPILIYCTINALNFLEINFILFKLYSLPQ